MLSEEAELSRRKIVDRLPSEVRWCVPEDTVNFDFLRATRPLRPFAEEKTVSLVDGEPGKEWMDLLLFGEIRISDCGGANAVICIHQDSGEILGLDVERDGSNVFFFNSNIDKFIDSFLTIDAWLRLGVGTLESVRARLIEIDADRFNNSEWQPIFEYLRCNDAASLVALIAASRDSHDD